MNGEGYGIEQFASETTAGHCATLAALVIALQESGVLPWGNYGKTLHQFWAEMPEDVAIGEAGSVIERVLELVDRHETTARSKDARQPKLRIGTAA